MEDLEKRRRDDLLAKAKAGTATDAELAEMAQLAEETYVTDCRRLAEAMKKALLLDDCDSLRELLAMGRKALEVTTISEEAGATPSRRVAHAVERLRASMTSAQARLSRGT